MRHRRGRAKGFKRGGARGAQTGLAKHKRPERRKGGDPGAAAPPAPEAAPGTGPAEGGAGVAAAEAAERNRKLNFLFWLRIGLAVAAGTAATFLFEGIAGEERRWASIAFMIVVFFGSIIFAKTMNLRLPSSDRKKIVTQGIGSYVFIYLFMWIVSYTFVNLPEGSGLGTPFG